MPPQPSGRVVVAGPAADPSVAPMCPAHDSSHRAFRPPAWLHNRHLQTIAGWFLRRGCSYPYVRRRLDTPDGDFLDIDGSWDDPRLSHASPICLVLHGLEGSSASGYAARTCRLLRRAGVRPFVLNFRSCSGEPNRKLRSYHSGETADIAFVAQRLRAEYPGATLGAIGYSLGGNALLCRLAERGHDSEFDVAAAVSVPFDLAGGASCLERGMGRVYTRFFLGSLRTKIREKARRFPASGNRADAALRASTMRELDEAWTAPIHGFRDADHYYELCSSLPRLAQIRVRTLLLQAADDPFVPPSTVESVARVENPALERDLPHFGGHLGYVSANRRPRLWAEARASAWIAHRLADDEESEKGRDAHSR